MSLSNEPVLSTLKNDYICGYKDISRKRYAGASGKHQPDGVAVDTTNGAGPHNIQIFVLAPDGTVLHCLPGYWCSEDLLTELQFANQMWDLYKSDIPEAERDAQYRQAHMQHLGQHTKAMKSRSHLQHFDIKHERDRLPSSDVFWNTRLALRNPHDNSTKVVKTADVIMHQRMSMRPFVPYEKFDVAAYSDYGKPMYDKHENRMDGQGNHLANGPDDQFIGNDPRAHPIETAVKRQVKRQTRNAMMRALQIGVNALKN